MQTKRQKIQRAADVLPQLLIDALLPLGKLDPPWLRLEHINEREFSVFFREGVQIPPLLKLVSVAGEPGSNWASFLAWSKWLAHGPKICRPDTDRCEALSHIEVRLQMSDLSMPFPEVLVELPEHEMFGPYNNVIVARIGDASAEWTEQDVLACMVSEPTHLHDICTLVRSRSEKGWTVEKTLQTFDATCVADAPYASMALRVAINSCLMLSGHAGYLLPTDHESNLRLSRERTPRGDRALKRLPLDLMIAAFDQEIKYKVTENRGSGEAGEPTGRHMPPHWRSGHWHTVLYGEKKSLRKRKLYPATKVRWDLFTGDDSDTMVTYK